MGDLFMKICPCRDCQDRKLGCHSECDKYKDWSEWNQQQRDKLHRQATIANIGRRGYKK